jgi:hypothetical protein
MHGQLDQNFTNVISPIRLKHDSKKHHFPSLLLYRALISCFLAIAKLGETTQLPIMVLEESNINYIQVGASFLVIWCSIVHISKVQVKK